MPIYKSKTPTKDGRKFFYKVSYKDAFGNSKTVVSKKFFTKTEAKKEEAIFLNDINASTNNYVDLTMNQLVNKFLEYKDDKVRTTTKNGYDHKKRYLESLSDIKCKDFTIEVFEEWKKEVNSVPTISTAYKNDILKFLKSILNYGMMWYNLDFNSVYRRITNFSNPNELKKEMSFYTYDEFKRFLAMEKDLQHRCLWETLYFCGLRNGEARGLTWDSIDFKNRRIKISKQVQTIKQSGGQYYIAMPKTRDSYRTIPMCDSLYNDLMELHDKIKDFKRYNDNFFVFGRSQGMEPYCPSAIRTRCNKLSKMAGLKHIRIHDFRHSCASLLINSGASVTMVAKYLGHTKIDVTLNTYSHMFQSALDGVINIINDLTLN